MQAKLVRKIPAGKTMYGEQLPHYFDKYELECIDCGAHYISGHFDTRTVPYCPDCKRKYEAEKQRERNKRKEQAIRNAALREVRTSIDGTLFIHRQKVLRIIDSFIKE